MVDKTAWTRVWYRSTRIKIIVNLPLYEKYGAMNSCSQMLDCIFFSSPSIIRHHYQTIRLSTIYDPAYSPTPGRPSDSVSLGTSIEIAVWERAMADGVSESERNIFARAVSVRLRTWEALLMATEQECGGPLSRHKAAWLEEVSYSTMVFPNFEPYVL